ncbi:MAG: nucleotidyltransferase, partial [Bacteroidetes bacterium]|nr:nucleotidyltransferase [Bacteroidota bacterium]
MYSIRSSKVIPILLDAIDIPNSAYEKAIARYEDFGGWLCRPDSSCSQFSPTVFPQGSFLLGTVTRPSNAQEEYDLDIAVKLVKGISKQTHTQKELKSLVGREIEAYRQARRIEEELREKKRCWRLDYRDQLSFHMDILPCVPKSEDWQYQIERKLIASIANELLAAEIARNSVSITDIEHPDYDLISSDWNVSNPQGYGRWFASRVHLAENTIRDRLRMERKANIEQIPPYRLKAPLQRCVQLLKVHRDRMFQNAPDQKPISI